MNILLVYPNISSSEKLILGLAYISAVLKEEGHEVELYDTTWRFNEKELLRCVKNKDLVGFSVLSLERNRALEISKIIKENEDVPILWGGVHATVDPEDCLNTNFVDYICIGEGEDAIKEFIQKYEAGQDLTEIQNIWSKQDGQIKRTEIRDLIQNLDRLPFPDREIFDRRHLCIDTGSPFLGSRGCPFGCTYCINNCYLKMYKNKGNYGRYRTVNNLLDEIEFVKEKYDIKIVEFADETITIRKKWIREFAPKYQNRIGLPFVFQTRCETVDLELLKILKTAGCKHISFGIESGNEVLRQKILKRKMSNDQIINAFELAKKVNIATTSFNMVGLPFETEQMILDTIKLNKRIKTKHHNVCIFYPFKGTKLEEICQKKNWIKPVEYDLESYYHDTILDMPQLDRLTILTYQKFWKLYMIFPELFFPIMTHTFRNVLKIMDFIINKTKFRLLKIIFDHLFYAIEDFRKLPSKILRRLRNYLKR
ncbi:MAG: B12-binding domain-containing radical SAM protein [Candidatus Helarchaeota archaeon]|nr:B12-binding domain-containing radical SAM protein [Candidatus Helarchaeota archaeon]